VKKKAASPGLLTRVGQGIGPGAHWFWAHGGLVTNTKYHGLLLLWFPIPIPYGLESSLLEHPFYRVITLTVSYLPDFHDICSIITKTLV